MPKGKKKDGMYIVTVIPIARGVGKEHLSYFSSKEYEPGTVVTAPIRKKYSPSIVTSIKDVKDMKSELRAADFSLKKIRPQNGSTVFHPAFIEVTRRASDYFAATTGALLSTLVPKHIISKHDSLCQERALISGETTSGSCESLILQACEEERHMQFKSIVREEFARGKSVFFLIPTLSDAERVAEAIEKGVEDYIYIFHGNLSAKKMRETWKKTSKEKHPVAVIATGQFLSIPRNDFGTFVIEHEGSPLYKTRHRPFTDMRWVTEGLACTLGARCVLADTILRTETIWRYKEGEFLDLYPPKFRYADETASHVIDMTDARLTMRGSVGGLAVLSEHLSSLIEHIQSDGGHMFLFTARKGLRPLTVCGDCGDPLICEHCSYPLVLHPQEKAGQNEPVYICRVCGKQRSSRATCTSCGSWKLDVLGIGIDLVEQVIRKGFGDIPIFVLDASRVKSRSEAKKLLRQFRESERGILLSTQMGLSYLKHPVDFSAIISVDSLLALPDIGMAERVFSTITEIKHRTKKTFLLQTRRADNDLLHWAVMGNITSLYRSEIQDREQFSYPPFSVLIKITATGSIENMRDEFRKSYKNLKQYEPEFYPSFTPSPKGEPRMHALIKIKRRDWPEKELLDILRSLPPSLAVDVAPTSLL